VTGFYAEDLAYVHHTGFGSFAQSVAPEVIGILRGAGVGDGVVVDLGCGTGILAAALTAAGYEVLGVDCAPAMIDIARGTAPGARFVVSSLYDADLPPCAAVLAIGEGLTYVGSDDPRSALPGFFRRVHRALAPGGVLLFDLVLRSTGEPMSYQAAREGPDWRVDVDVSEEPERSLLTRRIRVERQIGRAWRASEEVHTVRTFAADEVQTMLEASGFTVDIRQGFGAMPLPPQRAAFVARKSTGG
jgi:SAM-dependent methyltransferase